MRSHNASKNTSHAVPRVRGPMLFNNLLSLHTRRLFKNVTPSRVRLCVSMSDAPSAAQKVGKLYMIGAPQLEQHAVSMFPRFSLVPDLRSMQSNTHVLQPHAPLDAVIIGPHLPPSSGGTPPHPEHPTPSQPPASAPESPAAPAPAPAPPASSASADAPPLYMAQLARVTVARAVCPTAFIVMWHPLAVEDAPLRVAGFEAGANMVGRAGGEGGRWGGWRATMSAGCPHTPGCQLPLTSLPRPFALLSYRPTAWKRRLPTHVHMHPAPSGPPCYHMHLRPPPHSPLSLPPHSHPHTPHRSHTVRTTWSQPWAGCQTRSRGGPSSATGVACRCVLELA